jgi:hypothetical protein
VRLQTQRAANVAISAIVPWNSKNHLIAAMGGIVLAIVARASSFSTQTRRDGGVVRSNLSSVCHDGTLVASGNAATMTRIGLKGSTVVRASKNSAAASPPR